MLYIHWWITAYGIVTNKAIQRWWINSPSIIRSVLESYISAGGVTDQVVPSLLIRELTQGKLHAY